MYKIQILVVTFDESVSITQFAPSKNFVNNGFGSEINFNMVENF